MPHYPRYGCLFCDKHYHSLRSLSLHHDSYLSEWTTANQRLPQTDSLDSHPVDIIRYMRMAALRRRKPTDPVIVWNPITVAPAPGELWDIVVPIVNFPFFSHILYLLPYSSYLSTYPIPPPSSTTKKRMSKPTNPTQSDHHQLALFLSRRPHSATHWHNTLHATPILPLPSPSPIPIVAPGPAPAQPVSPLALTQDSCSSRGRKLSLVGHDGSSGDRYVGYGARTSVVPPLLPCQRCGGD